MDKIQNTYLSVSGRTLSLEERMRIRDEMKELLFALDRSIDMDGLAPTQKGLIEGLGTEFGLVNVTPSQIQKTAKYSSEISPRLDEINKYFSFVLQNVKRDDIDRGWFRTTGNTVAIKRAVDQIFSNETEEAKYSGIQQVDYTGILKELLKPLGLHVVLDQTHLPALFLTAAKIVANEDPSQIRLFNIYQGIPFIKFTCLKIEDELKKLINELEKYNEEPWIEAKRSLNLPQNEKFREGDLLKMLLDPLSIDPPIDQAVLDRIVSLIAQEQKFHELRILCKNNR
jgi:hypothetical protein